MHVPGNLPALVNRVLAGYYNVSGKPLWADGMIFLRVFVMPCASLYALLSFGWDPWLFLFFGEVLTLAFWYTASGIAHRRDLSRFRFPLGGRFACRAGARDQFFRGQQGGGYL